MVSRAVDWYLLCCRLSAVLWNRLMSAMTSCLVSSGVDEVHACSFPLTGIATAVPHRWPSGKASASRAKDPGFESHLRQ